MRWFVFVKIMEAEIQDILDLMIFIANPAEKNVAHITIAGPFPEEPIDLIRNGREISGNKLHILGAADFFSDGQTTVILKCNSYHFEKYWSKYDYGYNPHITLYNGPSLDFARTLRMLLSKHRMEFSLTCGEVVSFSSSRRRSDQDLRHVVNLRLLREISARDYSHEEIENMRDWARLTLLSRLCSKLTDSRLHARSRY